jgi:hypothetical protein
MFVLAVHDARAGGFFQGADGEQAFHENFEELDEAAVFLYGDNQSLVLVA